jgi:hypothetical protein
MPSWLQHLLLCIGQLWLKIMLNGLHMAKGNMAIHNLMQIYRFCIYEQVSLWKVPDTPHSNSKQTEVFLKVCQSSCFFALASIFRQASQTLSIPTPTWWNKHIRSATITAMSHHTNWEKEHVSYWRITKISICTSSLESWVFKWVACQGWLVHPNFHSASQSNRKKYHIFIILHVPKL